MEVIRQDNDGIDREWPALAGRLEHLPKFVNVFGQESSAAFQQRNREKKRAAGNKGAYVLRHDSSLIPLLKAGCVSLSRPTAEFL
jgi:hypothetical protein